jgi:hypothetical protein
MKLAYDPGHSSVFENGDGTVVSNVRRNKANCPSFEVCLYWALVHKNVSVFLNDFEFEFVSDNASFVGKNGEPLLCRIDDGVFLNIGAVMVMFYGEPILKRVNEIFDRVVEAGLYKFWFSRIVNQHKVKYKKIAIVNPLDEYYSFKLDHMQPAFYLLLIGWSLSVLKFVIEVFCYHLSNKRKEIV